jgi:hypothetical protein
VAYGISKKLLGSFELPPRVVSFDIETAGGSLKERNAMRVSVASATTPNCGGLWITSITRLRKLNEFNGL